MTTAPTSSLPQFYKQPVPLDAGQHADLTIGPSPSGYRFAAEAQAIMLASVELFEASREYPVIFTVSSDGSVLPLALMGLKEGENLFVGADGAWQGGYLPAYIRRYPFITTEAAEQMAVCFDESFDGFNVEGGTPLFEKGEQTPRLQEILAFLQDYYQQIQQTRQFGAMLAQAGLLTQINAQANLGDGSSYALNGMLVVDEQRLNQLPDTDIVRLFRNGSLALIHAHLLSLRNLGRLIERKNSRR